MMSFIYFVKLVESIGELSKRLSEDLRNKYPSIPWKEIRRRRDSFAHTLYVVDLRRAYSDVSSTLSQYQNIKLMYSKEFLNDSITDDMKKLDKF